MTLIQQEARRILQTILAQHSGNISTAYEDICHRYADALLNDVCPGFRRWGMSDLGADPKIDVPANPITDEWIATGVDA